MYFEPVRLITILGHLASSLLRVVVIDFDDWRMAQIFQRGIGVGRGNLVIPNVTYEERGQFKCVVQTKSDSATLWAEVKVFGTSNSSS